LARKGRMQHFYESSGRRRMPGSGLREPFPFAFPGALRQNPDHTMNWFVYRDNTAYGPYLFSQLASFLTRDDLVAAEGSDNWVKAGEEPRLAEIFEGYLEAKLEWWVQPGGKPKRGPFTIHALVKILERSEIGPNDLIRHESWNEMHALGKTMLWEHWKTSGTKLETIPPEQLSSAPKASAAVVPKPPRSGAAQVGGALRRMTADFEFDWKMKLVVLLLALSPPLGYGYYQFWYRGSDAELLSGTGAAEGPCATDPTSQKICGQKPHLCGCGNKGECEMRPCVVYGKMKASGAAGR
jgi:hypothetical protein